MKISVNAPSYRRPSAVLTLDYLPFCNIWVDESEAEEYRRNYPEANIVSCPKGIQGNLCRIRNYILKTEFDNGADVVLIVDDDLKGIYHFVMDSGGYLYNRKLVQTENFLEFLEHYSLLAREFGAKFWGLNCNADAMSYKPDVPFNTNAYIGGPFQCFLRGNQCWYDESLPLKEDYDMTLQQLNEERVVLRLNMYHYICKQSVNPGGCATYRNRDREQQQFEALQRKWGTKIVKRDRSNKGRSEKEKPDDYNPIIKIPIKGI